MTRKPILILFLYCLILASPFATKGQTIVEQKVGKDISSNFPHYEWLHKDPQGGYLLSIGKSETNTAGFYLDEELIPTHHHVDDDDVQFMEDLFICKLDANFSLEKSFVIDNAEVGRDVYCGQDYVLYSMSIAETQANRDSFPILLNGIDTIPREDHVGTGVVVVLNKDLQLVKYFFPSTGEIGQIAVDGHMAYLELRIPDGDPYIIVNGTDTVFNQRYSQPPYSYGLQTVVLCKYNLLTNQIEWLLRIGNVGFEELIEMHVDEEHNLVILGSTNSTYFFFHGMDTVMNNSDHNPFLAKYSSDGDLLLGIMNQHQVFETATDLYIDRDNNYFIRSFYNGDKYQVEDTTLVSLPYNTNRYPSRGFIRKYNKQGEFQWAWQLEGAFEVGPLYGIVALNNDIVISGAFREGELYLGQDTFYNSTSGDIENGFLLFLNKDDGSFKQYIMTQGKYHRRFFDLHADYDNNLDLFMRYSGKDTIFDTPFESSQYEYNGYLLKLSFSPLATAEPSTNASLFSILPNPSTNSGFFLDALESLTPQPQPFVIFDSVGRKLVTNLIWPGEKQFIETSDWPAGPYWIQMQNGGQSQTQLIIVQ